MAKDRAAVLRWSDVPECTYVPAERVKAMDADGVDVHTFYPNVGSVQQLNKREYPEEFRQASLRACNEIQIDEYVKAYPGRFIGIAVIPLWDPKKAVEEFHWAAERALKGVAFAFPQQFGYPHTCDPAWAPLWAALQEADMPVHMRIGSGGSMGMSWEVWPGHTDHCLGAGAAVAGMDARPHRAFLPGARRNGHRRRRHRAAARRAGPAARGSVGRLAVVRRSAVRRIRVRLDRDLVRVDRPSRAGRQRAAAASGMNLYQMLGALVGPLAFSLLAGATGKMAAGFVALSLMSLGAGVWLLPRR